MAKTESARERILETAATLFYKEGVRAVGVDRLIEEAAVAKATFYRWFPSKDDLVLAFLDRRAEQWTAWFVGAVERLAAPPKGARERLVAIFDALGEWFADPDFRGCVLVNTAQETADPEHVIFRTCAAKKRGVDDFVASLAREAALPAEAAEELSLLIEGAIVKASLNESAEPARWARRAAERLLTAA